MLTRHYETRRLTPAAEIEVHKNLLTNRFFYELYEVSCWGLCSIVATDENGGFEKIEDVLDDAYKQVELNRLITYTRWVDRL